MTRVSWVSVYAGEECISRGRRQSSGVGAGSVYSPGDGLSGVIDQQSHFFSPSSA